MYFLDKYLLGSFYILCAILMANMTKKINAENIERSCIISIIQINTYNNSGEVVYENALFPHVLIFH